jgi:carbamoylphosphate synthase small subunit
VKKVTHQKPFAWDPEDELSQAWRMEHQADGRMHHARRPIFSVQYHPEASPSPHDADRLFDGFRKLILD